MSFHMKPHEWGRKVSPLWTVMLFGGTMAAAQQMIQLYEGSAPPVAAIMGDGALEYFNSGSMIRYLFIAMGTALATAYSCTAARQIACGDEQKVRQNSAFMVWFTLILGAVLGAITLLAPWLWWMVADFRFNVGGRALGMVAPFIMLESVLIHQARCNGHTGSTVVGALLYIGVHYGVSMAMCYAGFGYILFILSEIAGHAAVILYLVFGVLRKCEHFSMRLKDAKPTSELIRTLRTVGLLIVAAFFVKRWINRLILNQFMGYSNDFTYMSTIGRIVVNRAEVLPVAFASGLIPLTGYFHSTGKRRMLNMSLLSAVLILLVFSVASSVVMKQMTVHMSTEVYAWEPFVWTMLIGVPFLALGMLLIQYFYAAGKWTQALVCMALESGGGSLLAYGILHFGMGLDTGAYPYIYPLGSLILMATAISLFLRHGLPAQEQVAQPYMPAE